MCRRGFVINSRISVDRSIDHSTRKSMEFKRPRPRVVLISRVWWCPPPPPGRCRWCYTTYYLLRSLSACVIFSSSFEVVVVMCTLTIITTLVIITTEHPPPMEASQSWKISVATFSFLVRGVRRPWMAVPTWTTLEGGTVRASVLGGGGGGDRPPRIVLLLHYLYQRLSSLPIRFPVRSILLFGFRRTSSKV